MTDAIPYAVLTVNEMYSADMGTIDAGTSGIDLMSNAGQAIVNHLRPALKDDDRVLVACGTGNNGGDGFIVAARLHTMGFPVDVLLMGEASAVSSDAKLAMEQLPITVTHFSAVNLDNYTVVIDALLGAGLSRDISGDMATLIQTINQAKVRSSIRVISVDLPTGVNGDNGQVYGNAITADETITFFRKKPGHLLYPGRSLCGHLVLADIGIDAKILNRHTPSITENDPAWWKHSCPQPAADGHKYSRGHAVVLSGGPTSTGAARMAADAALRTGAGLVTLCCTQAAIAENAAQLTAIMLKQIDSAEQLRRYLEDTRITSVTLGPGLGIGDYTRQLVRTALASTQSVVLDADALTSFEQQPDVLFDLIRQSINGVVLTPHDGEFRRLFGLDTADASPVTDKVALARQASTKSGAVVLYKGPDTVITNPDGHAVINTNAGPWLATAGSGDVLAGTISAWLAQGMDTFLSACAACWMHGESGKNYGPGLIATDIARGYPAILRRLYN